MSRWCSLSPPCLRTVDAIDKSVGAGHEGGVPGKTFLNSDPSERRLLSVEKLPRVQEAI